VPGTEMVFMKNFFAALVADFSFKLMSAVFTGMRTFSGLRTHRSGAEVGYLSAVKILNCTMGIWLLPYFINTKTTFGLPEFFTSGNSQIAFRCNLIIQNQSS
jgi:hypothetical protein